MGVTNAMEKLLNKLVEVLVAACGDNLKVDVVDGVGYFYLNIGTLGATHFDGLWGAANMPAQNLELSFSIDADFVSDGQVYVKTDAESLVYGSDIEGVIEDMIKGASNGMISGTGSEQGMQGDFDVDGDGYGHCYSIDVEINSPVFVELVYSVPA
jgi:hypothetical protein